jgi:chromosome segregation ATPase
MDEIKKLNEKSETIFDLARKYPNKTYKELEAYRDADRQEELEPMEGEEQDNPELFDWKEKYNKEHKLRQEAETETILVKGIGINSPEMKAANKKIEELQGGLERARKENNDLYNRLADALEVNESHQRLNGKLQVRIVELEDDNKKISKQVEDQVERARKAGL